MSSQTLNLILVLVVIGCLSGCDRASDVRVLKMGHTLESNHPVHNAMLYMSDRLKDISNGKMEIEVYSGGQLGSERELMELLQIGSLAMTKVSSAPMEGFVSEMKIFNIPYVFRDREHFWRALSSDIGRDILLAGEKVHLRGLGYFDAGSRSFYTINEPVHKPEDLLGLKIRVQQSQTALRMVEALGGSPTPIAWGELYTALSQGVVDGAENNPPSFYSSKHYEITKYYTLNEHTWVPDIVVISSHIWNTLTDQQKRWLQKAMDDAVAYEKELWNKSTESALAAVKKAGVTIIRPDKEPFIKLSEQLHESHKGTPLYNLIQTFKNI